MQRAKRRLLSRFGVRLRIAEMGAGPEAICALNALLGRLRRFSNSREVLRGAPGGVFLGKTPLNVRGSALHQLENRFTFSVNAATTSIFSVMDGVLLRPPSQQDLEMVTHPRIALHQACDERTTLEHISAPMLVLPHGCEKQAAIATRAEARGINLQAS